MSTFSSHRTRAPRPLIVFLGLVIAFLPVSNAFAQGGTRGAISGTVKDPSGGVIGNAQVEIINQDTGVTERTVRTGDDGLFTATLLPVGTYRIVISAAGFARAEAPDIRVRVAETTPVTINMTVGELTEAVTVEGAATDVQLTDASTGRTLTAETIDRQPLPTRNFLSLLALSTGATSDLADTAALGRGAVSITVNGQRPVNNNYQLEGINANDFNLPTFDNVPLPNPQTLQEFKTQTSLYDASQGRNGGGNIQVALKSGTSEYHGDLFEFFRNDVLNANDFFLNRAGQPRPVLRQNQFGGSFGGPVPKIKDFFFFGNYQGTRAQSGIAAGTIISTNIPVLPADRSEANLRRIFFPTGLPAGFSGLDPVALAYLNLPAEKCPGFNDGQFCIPSLPGTPGLTAGAVNLANLQRSGVGRFDDDQFTISLDKQLTSKDKIVGRWFYSDNSTTRPFGTGSTLAHPVAFPGENRFLKVGWTRVISPRMVNEARFGFNRFFFGLIPTEPILLSDVGATRGNSASIPAAFRIAVTGSGAFSLGTGVNDDRGGAFNTFVYADDFSYTRGAHTFRAGGEITRYQLNRFNRFATRGSVAFANFGDLTGFQNFLIGRITSTQGRSGFSTFYFRALDAAAYVQDDWKIKPTLTLNLGVRWEGLSIANEKFNFLTNFAGLGDNEPAPPMRFIHPEETPVVGTPGVSRCTMLDCFDANNFAPRLGFAWDVTGKQRTVLRGGYGIYYQRTSNQPLLQTSGGPPFSEDFSNSFPEVNLQNPFPFSRPDSDFPLPTEPVIPRLVGFDGATGAPIFDSATGGPFSGFRFFPVRNFRSPYAQHYNLTLQHELFDGWIAEIGYVGTRGVNLIGTGAPLNAGQICTEASPCIIPADVASGVSVPAGTPFVSRNSDGSIAITGSTADNINARVPVRLLGIATSRLFAQDQAAQSTYNSLQTSLTRQFSEGLYFQGAYTWSKSLDNSSGSQFTDELNGLFGWGDLFNPKGQIGVSDFDRTHRLVVSYVWELPFARWAEIEDRGIGRLVNGWSLQGVTIFQSGLPFNIIDSSALTLQDTQGINGTNFATLAPGRTLSDVLKSGGTKSKLDEFINLDAFLVGGACVDNQNRIVSSGSPACTGFAAVGDVSRNRFRGPFQQNWDMSLIKMNRITERTSLEFRAEFFNIFNHPVFASPQAAGGVFGNYGIVDVSSGDASIFNTANDPRIIQFALKLSF